MGKEIIREIISNTGLPEETMMREMTRLLEKAGLSDNEVTIDEIRMILAEYLQDVLIEAKEDIEKDVGPLDCA